MCRNPFQSIIVRSVETLHACEEALRIIDEYEMPDAPAVEVQPRAGRGYGSRKLRGEPCTIGIAWMRPGHHSGRENCSAHLAEPEGD